MKKLVYVLAFISLQSCSVFNSKSILINGYVENNSAYLGGTPPRDGMEENLAVYRQSSNQDFYIRKDSIIDLKKPILMQFKTDENGKYTISLPKGIYSVFMNEKIQYAKYAKKMAMMTCRPIPKIGMQIFPYLKIIIRGSVHQARILSDIRA